MNWYGHSKNKVLKAQKYAVPADKRVYRNDDGSVDVDFIMTRPGGTFKLTTKNPISSSLLSMDTSSLFQYLTNRSMLTTPAARRRRDEQERQKINQQKPLHQTPQTVPETTVKENPIQNNTPKQMEFNFASYRSMLMHKKSMR